MKTTTLTFELDEKSKEEFERICADWEMTSAEVFNLLVQKTIKDKAVPLEIFDEEENDEDDPFYNPENIAHYIDLYEKYKRGELKAEVHDLIEV